MKGVLAYVLPKLLKFVGGVAVGIFVFTTFKSIFEPIYSNIMNNIVIISQLSDDVVGRSSALSYNWCDWIRLANTVLPLDDLMNGFATYLTIMVTFVGCRHVFRVLDTWMAGVTALVK